MVKPQTQRRVLVSADGRHSCEVEFYGKQYEWEKVSYLLGYDLRFEPRSATEPIAVLVHKDTYQAADPGEYGCGPGERDEMARAVAVARIGDWLGELSRPDLASVPDEPLGAYPEYLRGLADREPPPEGEVLRYMCAKSWAVYRFEQSSTLQVSFDRIDGLLLGATESDFDKIGRVHEEYWDPASASSPIFGVKSQLVRQARHGGLPGVARAPVYQVTDYLTEHRYQGPREYFHKAVEYLGNDPSNAVKEAIQAVESMGKVLTGKEDESFGPVFDAVEARGLLHPSLNSALQSLHGYASQVEGARHPSSGPPAVDEAEAIFVVNTAASALMMLREADPDR